jgi:hypothetical protein
MWIGAFESFRKDTREEDVNQGKDREGLGVLVFSFDRKAWLPRPLRKSF